jgi:hypothetical protein
MSAQKRIPTAVFPLSILVALLVTVASLAGLLWEEMYAAEPTSATMQARGQDLVNVVWVVPLFLVVLYYLRRGSLRARLAWLGILFYFVYTYLMAATVIAYNRMFLVYVAAYAVPLVLLIVGLTSLKIDTLANSFKSTFPRRGIGIFQIVAGVGVTLMWMGDILPSLMTGDPPARLMEQVSQSLVVQAMDLGLVVPMSLIGGITLLQNKPIGYLLSAISLMKVVTLVTAIISMIVFMARAGIEIAIPECIFFGTLEIIGLYFAVRYFLNVKSEEPHTSFNQQKELGYENTFRPSTE